MKKLKLVENWREGWRWVSVQCMGGAIALQGAWLFIPDDMKSGIHPDVIRWCAYGLLAIGFVGRFVKQEPPACPPDDKP